MIDLPIQERTIGRLVEVQAANHGERRFLDFKGEQSVSYRELHERSNSYANGLLANGVSHGTKVAVMLPNCPEYLYCWFGLAKIGAVMVPVNTAHKGDVLSYMIDKSDTEYIIVDVAWLNRIADIRSDIPRVKRIWSNGTAGNECGSGEVGDLEELKSHGNQSVASEVRHSDPLTILFTSGTTGPSKGVVMSHHYYFHAALTIGAGMEDSANDILYTCLPLFHVNAQVCTVLAALIYDAQVALYEHFSASSFWREIRNSSATSFLALGAMGNILAKAAPSKKDAEHSVRLAMVVPPPEDLSAFESRFGLRVVYETFGMTEGIVTPPRIAEPRRPGCCGKPTVDTEVKIFDGDDAELAPREIGEIVIRPRTPYTMMNGYYQMPEETVEAFRNLWFHTGDLGWLDEDGYLYFVGRKKEAMRRRGENISAFEVERTVNQHPSVLESAAIPVRSELSEDDVKIVVVLNDGAVLAPEALIEFCEQRMAYFMVPRFVEFRQSLPKTPTQRVEKYKLEKEGNGPGTWDRELAGYRLRRD